MDVRMLSAIFFFIIAQGPRWETLAWDDDMFYFTSFQNVDEWPKLYATCRIDESTALKDLNGKDLSKTGKVRTHHLSPIRLPAHKTLPQRRNLENGTLKPLFLFTHHPPPKRLYSVSYGFQKNKECLHNSVYDPCIISPALGLNRAVVLNAERESLLETRRNFNIEAEERFVTLQNGVTGDNEKKFYEAVFMGNVEGSKGNRSTHTIDGKAYPMEIYLFFVDESLPVMNACTVLVILVEESEKENEEAVPVVKAVKNHLQLEERTYIKHNRHIFSRERTYHHLGPTTIKDEGNGDFIELKDSWRLHYRDAESYSAWEKYHYLAIQTTLRFQRYKEIEQGLKKISFLYFEGGEDNDENFLNLPFMGEDITREFYQFWLYPAIAKYFEGKLDFPPHYLDKSQPYKGSKLEKRVNYPAPLDDEVFALVKEYIEILQKYDSRQHLRDENSVSSRNLTSLFSTFQGIADVRETPQERQAEGKEPKPQADSTLIYDRLFLILDNLTMGNLGFDVEQDGYPDFTRDLLFPLILKIWGPEYEGLIEDLKDVVKSAGFASQDGVVEESHVRLFKERIELQAKKREEASQHFESPLQTTKKRLGPITGGNLGMSEKEFEAYENLSPTKTHLSTVFQVSWLIPDAGGYYVYKGSSPLTPCHAVQETIVFRKPIKMSREQIQVLTTVPTSHLRERDIRNTLGRLHPHRPYVENDLGIVYEDRAHQYLGDDDRHDNSVTKGIRKKQLANGSQKNEILLRNKLLIAVIIIISIVCTYE